MEQLFTLADRLKDAMKAREGRSEITASELARACGVSPTAVHKWLGKGGQSQKPAKMSADNYANAARALGVRDEWLRTGRLPRERTHVTEERELDRAIEILGQIGMLLGPLQQSINELTRARTSSADKRKGKS